MPLKTAEIQDGILKHYFDKHNCRYGISNFSGCGYSETDVFAVTKSMIVYAFEVKISRNDFKKEFKDKKHKHEYYSNKLSSEDRYHKRPNKYFFVCPSGLIKPTEVPDHAGLIYVDAFTLNDSGRRHFEISVVKDAPYIHREKATVELLVRMCQSLTQRMIFGCALMTYRNKLSAQRFKQLTQ